MATRIRLTNEDFYFWGFNLQNKWLEIRLGGGNLASYFADNCLDKVAIYGAGALGRRLLEELKDCDIDVKCLVDKNGRNISDIKGTSVVGFDDEWPELDAIIITPIFFYEISASIREKIGDEINIIAIDDVIDYCFMGIKG